MMNKEEIIYPSMVIRSQSEAIELLEKQNNDLQQRIDKAIEYINKLKEYPYLERYYVGELLEILGGKE